MFKLDFDPTIITLYLYAATSSYTLIVFSNVMC